MLSSFWFDSSSETPANFKPMAMEAWNTFVSPVKLILISCFDYTHSIYNFIPLFDELGEILS